LPQPGIGVPSLSIGRCGRFNAAVVCAVSAAGVTQLLGHAENVATQFIKQQQQQQQEAVKPPSVAGVHA